MKIQTKNRFQYAYTQSFRNTYHKNIPNMTQASSPKKNTLKTTNLTLQYESPTHQQIMDNQQSPQKLTNQVSNNNTQQFTLQNFSKRLHSTHKKYSFSVFIKQSKQKDQSRKSPTKNLSTVNQSTIQRKKDTNAIKKLNNHAIKTFYKNFRNDPNFPIRKLTDQQIDIDNLRILSQRQIKIKNYDVQNFMNKTTRVQSYKKSYLEEKSSQNNQKHFFNTISYGENFITRSTSTERQKQIPQFTKTSRQKQSPKNNFYLQSCPQQSYSQSNDTFLKIEKCLIEKKDQNFVKDCYDFKEILLKQQHKRELNKKKQTSLLKLLHNNKRQPKFFDSSNSKKSPNNKYVSQMRQKKKVKKLINLNDKVDDEFSGNGIQPW